MIARFCLVLGCLALLSCGRPLSEGEQQFLTRIHGPELDMDRLRIVKGAPLSQVTFRRKPRPRVTCRERILPPVKDEIVTSSPAALALFNRIFFVRDWYIDDYMPAYPERLYLVEAMLLAYEVTHVWQWQNWARTGYTLLRAAGEHRGNPDG